MNEKLKQLFLKIINYHWVLIIFQIIFLSLTITNFHFEHEGYTDKTVSVKIKPNTFAYDQDYFPIKDKYNVTYDCTSGVKRLIKPDERIFERLVENPDYAYFTGSGVCIISYKIDKLVIKFF